MYFLIGKIHPIEFNDGFSEGIIVKLKSSNLMIFLMQTYQTFGLVDEKLDLTARY